MQFAAGKSGRVPSLFPVGLPRRAIVCCANADNHCPYESNFDTETGFYYLQSRYYDPIVKRFLNADSYASTGQGFIGYNMFAYCNNCPVIGADPAGHEMYFFNYLDIGGEDSYTDGISKALVYSADCTGIGGYSTSTVTSYGYSSNYYAYSQSEYYGSTSSYSSQFSYSTILQSESNYSNSISEQCYVAPNECTIVGGGHGNPIHFERIEAQISELASSGNYVEIYGNRALSTAGLIGNQRPDIIAKTIDGRFEIWEFASKSQAGGSGLAALIAKIQIMRALNPSADFKEIIPWN